jgi:hypothetical protein
LGPSNTTPDTSRLANLILGRLVIGRVAIVNESFDTSLCVLFPLAMLLSPTAEFFDLSFRHDVRYDLLCDTALFGA